MHKEWLVKQVTKVTVGQYVKLQVWMMRCLVDATYAAAGAVRLARIAPTPRA